MGVARSIAEEALRALSNKRRYAGGGRAPRPQMERVFKNAFKRIRRDLINDAVLGRYCLSRREFEQIEDPSLRRTILKDMRDFNTCTALLIFGTDERFRRHLFVVQDPGMISDRDQPGYWAIGEGATAALSALFAGWRGQPATYHELMYFLCAAKFSCEGIDSVGQMTNVLFTPHFQGQLIELHPRYVDQLRTVWQGEVGPPPPEALRIINKAIENRLIDS